MSQQTSFCINQFYTLDQVRPVVAKFKMLVCKPASIGLVYLYREEGSLNYWVGGPFYGKDSHLFLFLGPKQSKSQFLATLKDHFVEALGAYADWADQNSSVDVDWVDGFFDFDFGDHW